MGEAAIAFGSKIGSRAFRRSHRELGKLKVVNFHTWKAFSCAARAHPGLSLLFVRRLLFFPAEMLVLAFSTPLPNSSVNSM